MSNSLAARSDDLDAVLSSWDALAKWIGEQTAEIKAAAQRCAIQGLVIGEAVNRFAERPEIPAEAKAASEGRPGRPFTVAGYVAARLSERYGERVPSADWMVKCARAATKAKMQGLYINGVREILGHRDRLTAPDGPLINPPTPDRLLELTADAPARKPGDGAALSREEQEKRFARAFMRTFRRWDKDAQRLAAMMPSGQRSARAVINQYQSVEFEETFDQIRMWAGFFGLHIGHAGPNTPRRNPNRPRKAKR